MREEDVKNSAGYKKRNDFDLSLYAITDREMSGESGLESITEQILDSGATMLQLREKNVEKDEFIETGRAIKELCDKRNVAFIVNDDIDVAIALEADGIHVGQEDLAEISISELRSKMGERAVLGVSVHNVEEAREAELAGADYLGVGAVFPSSTKQDAVLVAHDEVKKICESVDIPVVAIGGITEENILQLRGLGLAGISLISALYGVPEPAEAARRMSMLAKSVAEDHAADDSIGFIFDMDGTMLDSLNHWDMVGSMYLENMGIEPEADLGKKLFEMTIEQACVYFKDRYGVDKSAQELARGLDEQMLSFYLEEIEEKNDLRKLLQAAEKKNIPMVVATTTTRSVAIRALQHHNLLDFFIDVVTPEDSMLSKHFDKIYLMAAGACGTKPQNTWVFEDAVYAARSAKKAGFKIAGILDRESREREAELREVSDIVFEHYADVSISDFVESED